MHPLKTKNNTKNALSNTDGKSKVTSKVTVDL